MIVLRDMDFNECNRIVHIHRVHSVYWWTKWTEGFRPMSMIRADGALFQPLRLHLPPQPEGRQFLVDLHVDGISYLESTNNPIPPQISPPFYHKCYRQIPANLTVNFCGNTLAPY